jgi:hypothetical protein
MWRNFLRNEKGGWRAFFSEKGAVRHIRLYITTLVEAGGKNKKPKN